MFLHNELFSYIPFFNIIIGCSLFIFSIELIILSYQNKNFIEKVHDYIFLMLMLFTSFLNLYYGVTNIKDLTNVQNDILLTFIIAYSIRFIFLVQYFNIDIYFNIKFFFHTSLGLLLTAVFVESYLVDLYCEEKFCIAYNFKNYRFSLFLFSIINFFTGLYSVLDTSNSQVNLLIILTMFIIGRIIVFIN